MGEIAQILERARQGLLDLSARNRLLNLPQPGSRAALLDLPGTSAAEIVTALTVERRALLPVGGDEPAAGADRPGDRGSELRLAVDLEPERLQRHLLRLFYDARTAREERGIETLHLVLGTLAWSEADGEGPREAPLLLLPVHLERANARAPFRIVWQEAEPAENVCLIEKLRREFGIQLPPLADGDDDPTITSYADRVAAALATTGFEVRTQRVALGLFTFTKLLMWRDLDPAVWPDGLLADHPLLRALLGDGFAPADDPVPDERRLDPLLPAREMVHVLDADGSQARAIATVRAGQDLLVQGPPGSGKSQTIVNLIAAAVHDGKRVLFVAEKMAALEVVQRRLREIGLDGMSLDLHSRRTRKQEVLGELRTALDDDAASEGLPAASMLDELDARRTELDRLAEALHAPIEPSGLTPFRLFGDLVRLERDGHTGRDLPDAASWDGAAIARRREAVAAFRARAEVLDGERSAVWRGVEAAVVLPGDLASLRGDARRLVAALETLAAIGIALGDELGQPPAATRTFAGISCLIRSAEHLGLAPSGLDAGALGDPVWQEQRTEIQGLARAGQLVVDAHERIGEVFRAGTIEDDHHADANRFGRLRRSWWRALHPGWRQAQRTLADSLLGRLPDDLEAQQELYDEIAAMQAAWRMIKERDDLGRRAFGALWRGRRTDLARIATVERWEGEGRDETLLPGTSGLLGRVGTVSGDLKLLDQVQVLVARVVEECGGLFRRLELDLRTAFARDSVSEIGLDELRAWLAAVAGSVDDLPLFVALQNARATMREAGLGWLVDVVESGGLPSAAAPDAFEAALARSLLRRASAERPVLTTFDAGAGTALVERFRELDRARVVAARAEVRHAARRGIDRAREGEGSRVLRRELEKRRRHLPLRKLLRVAGETVQAIKPVFLMSPLSVAEYLEPGAVTFDLLLIDEASQVEPVDALGAIARARQLVVVGDGRQLPPTSFFQKGIEEAGEEDETPDTADLESVLGLAAAAGMRQRMLRWHYRSRHPSLIAFANHAFYDDRLLVPPSPLAVDQRFGLSFHHLPKSTYDRGGTRANRDEARAVAERVIAHARSSPGRSLGVGCFGIGQRDAILAELELLWRDAPDVAAFFDDSRPERFFVKNLETIQGDERDVVLLSVGYGRDPEGHLSMGFGPLSRDGGERRLNVLVTRARERLEVFGAITDEDIDLQRARGRGVHALRRFLAYARTGRIDGVAWASGREPDSPFEREVARALGERGHEVVAQVGAAGFFVDLALADPDRPGRFLLGIECDGAPWHGTMFARDRDRLRQEVLESRGWIIHRIWSAAWYRQPEAELERVLAALGRAREVWAERDRPAAAPAAPGTGELVDDGDRDPGEAAPVTRYVEADFLLPGRPKPHEVPLPRRIEALLPIVRVEGPVHAEEVARRFARACGLERTGRRIRVAVDEALDAALAEGLIERDGDFVTLAGAAIRIRDRSAVRSQPLRQPDMIPPVEIEAAFERLTADGAGPDREALLTGAARLLGFQTLSGRLRARFEAVLDRTAGEGTAEAGHRRSAA